MFSAKREKNQKKAKEKLRMGLDGWSVAYTGRWVKSYGERGWFGVAVPACKLISHDREKLALNFELESQGDGTFNYRPLTLESVSKYPLRLTTVSFQFMVNLLNLLVSWSDKIFTLWILFFSISFFFLPFSLSSIYLSRNTSSVFD